jgi:ferrous iron transport protein B
MKTLSVALVGNPNTGKSTLFNALTGLNQHVGNYPGVTVERKVGKSKLGELDIHLIDLPGTYSLAARSPDEMVTVDLLLGHRPEEPRPDAIISIVDANNLERHLYLTTQLMELQVPIVLAVNLIDLAEKQKLKIDYRQLSQQLGIPVVPIQANRGIGLEELKKALFIAVENQHLPSEAKFPEYFEQEVSQLSKEVSTKPEPFLVRRMLFDIGGYSEKRATEQFGTSFGEKLEQARQRISSHNGSISVLEAKTRYSWIRNALQGCIERPPQKPITFSDKLDRILTHRFWGSLIFLVVMFVVFQSIFLWALPIMGLIDEGKELLASGIESILDPGPLRSLLIDGVLQGVGGVLIFLPQIMILFAFIAVLEDCGYMARAAFLMDKIMSKCGLNGKSFIPLLSSMACAIPGIMATRTIENRRDRLATIVVAPLMSCSARLPLYMLIIGVFLSNPWWLPGITLFGMYLLGLIVAPLVALTLKRTLLKGPTPLFVMEMPSFKMPQWKTVLRRMAGAGWAFVYRAGTIILASMILIWALLYFPNRMPDGKSSYDQTTTELQNQIDTLEEKQKSLETQDPKPEVELETIDKELNEKQERLGELQGEWKRQSLLGQAGHAMEPIFRPLGWDWRIGMAAIASFPAREVVVGTLGIIYNQGDVDPKEIKESSNPGDTPLGKAIEKEWGDDPIRGKYRIPVALSLMVFFALCCQCVSTLAIIKRETGSWLWPLFTFVYMTTLAYIGAFFTFQIGSLFVG